MSDKFFNFFAATVAILQLMSSCDDVESVDQPTPQQIQQEILQEEIADKQWEQEHGN